MRDRKFWFIYKFSNKTLLKLADELGIEYKLSKTSRYQRLHEMGKIIDELAKKPLTYQDYWTILINLENKK